MAIVSFKDKNIVYNENSKMVERFIDEVEIFEYEGITEQDYHKIKTTNFIDIDMLDRDLDCYRSIRISEMDSEEHHFFYCEQKYDKESLTTMLYTITDVASIKYLLEQMTNKNM